MKVRTLGVLAAALWLPAPALADAGPKIDDSLWLPMGLNLGYSLNPDPAPNGLLIGPEISFVYLDRTGYWGGVYTDLLHDTGPEQWRFSGGLEGGVAIFGMDVGYVGASGDEWQHGLRGRLLISLAAIHLYGGVGTLFQQPDAVAYGELGVLLKFPLQLWQTESRRPWMNRPPPDPPPPPPPPDQGAPYAPPPPYAQPPSYAEPPPN